MKLKKSLATAAVVSALSVGTAGIGGAVASADPLAPIPMKPGHGHDDDRGPGNGSNRHDNNRHDNRHDNGRDNGRDRNWNKGDWVIGGKDWWRGRPGKWWRDDALPPWGFWGPPPPVQWSGPPPWVKPRPINYWGHTVTPVWDEGFHGWGIWLFGVWIPIVGIGVA